MRDIKFRAWDARQKRIQTEFDVSSEGSVFKINMFETVESKDWILMQYTGLKDKNGKEIYEGDVLRFNIYGVQYSNYKVSWDNEDCSYTLIHATGEGDKYGVYTKRFNSQDKPLPVIVGNIYENPELLK